METSIREQFEYAVKFPSRLKSALFWGMTVVYTGWLSILFGVHWAVGIILLVGYGLLIGKFWIWIADKTATWLIINPLRAKVIDEKEPNFIQQQYLKTFLTRGSDQSFLQVSTVDRDISDIQSLINEFFPRIASFLAIMLTIARYLITTYGATSDTSINLVLVQSFVLAFPILGIYLPFSMLIEDSRIMNIDTSGAVEFLGGRVRRLIDGFFGITGIISGYTLFQDQSTSTSEQIFIFIGVLIILVILSIPVLFPTLYLYYQQHPILVNDFRRKAMQLEIYPAKTSAERLTSDEIRALVLSEEPEVEDKGWFGKVRQFFTGSRSVTTTYSDDQIKELELHGAWLCSNCNHINTSIQKDTFCTNCGQKQSGHDHQPPVEQTDHPLEE